MSQYSNKTALIGYKSHQYKLNCQKITAQKLQKEVDELRRETNRLELEKKWSYNSSGKRIRPVPEYKSAKIAENITHNPELEEDVLKELRTKRISLQRKTINLQRQLNKHDSLDD